MRKENSRVVFDAVTRRAKIESYKRLRKGVCAAERVVESLTGKVLV